MLQEKLVSSNKTVKRTKRREDYWKTKCTKLETTTDTTKEDYQQLIYELQADNDQQRTTITELQTALKEKDDQIAYLIEQLQEGDETRVIHLFDKKEKAFTPELHLCVYSLLEHNVPSTQIGPTIEACLKLAGKEPDRLPSPSTVANMNIQRLCLVKKQLQDELPEKINTTLHTDETSKVGIKYGGFSVRDEEGNYFALGLREMATKSAQNTLDTFKEILQDIADTRKETHPQSAGNEIVCNIQNTMSDRAATELKFNELLESYHRYEQITTPWMMKRKKQSVDLTISSVVFMVLFIWQMLHIKDYMKQRKGILQEILQYLTKRSLRVMNLDISV